VSKSECSAFGMNVAIWLGGDSSSRSGIDSNIVAGEEVGVEAAGVASWPPGVKPECPDGDNNMQGGSSISEGFAEELKSSACGCLGLTSPGLLLPEDGGCLSPDSDPALDQRG
jgi:hypothetical protein